MIKTTCVICGRTEEAVDEGEFDEHGWYYIWVYSNVKGKSIPYSVCYSHIDSDTDAVTDEVIKVHRAAETERGWKYDLQSR